MLGYDHPVLFIEFRQLFIRDGLTILAHCSVLALLEIRHRVGAAWGKWKKCSGMLCDRNMPVKLNGKLHRTVLGPKASIAVLGRDMVNNEKPRK